MNDRILRAARGEPTDRTPVWIMRQAGRYLPEYRAVREKVPFLTLCKTPELAAEVTVQPITRLGVDAAIIFSDILVIPEAMGMELELGDKGPHFPAPLSNEADIEALDVPDPDDRLRYVGDAIRATKKALAALGPAQEVPVIGFCGAPFTLASYMIEGGGSKNFLKAKRLMFEQPKLAHRLFEKLTEALIPYLSMQVEAGASMVQIFDSWGGELSPDDLETFSIPYVTRIVEALKAKGVPVVLFGTNLGPNLPLLAKTGADVLGCDWRVRMDEIREAVGPGPTLQGNLDPIALFLPEAELERRVKDILERAKGGGHIFNLGHGILPPTSPDAAKSLVEMVHRLSAP